MSKRLFLAVLAFGMLLTPGMARGQSQESQPGRPPAGNDKKASSPQQEAPKDAAAEDPEFIIGADDVLNITVWKEAEMSRIVQVRPDGKITLPLVNDVVAVGLTPMQLATSLTVKLKKFIADPQVSVTVVTINSRRVYLVGEVTRAGAFPLGAKMTVMQALSSAGGFTQFANQKKIYVLRTVDGKQVKIPFNYKKALEGDSSQNIELKPGDTIVVP